MGVQKRLRLQSVHIADLERPPPRAWVIPQLVPERAVSVMYGDAGVCKTWLATYLATVVTAGLSWLGTELAPRSVLFVDAELDEFEFTERAYRVAEGLGLTRPPDGLRYFDLRGCSLAERWVVDAVNDEREQWDCDLVILDSLSLATSGVDLKESAPMTQLMQSLRSWGTVLALDHTPKPRADDKNSAKRPYGSQFKYALLRSGIHLTRGSGDVLKLKVQKANFGPAGSTLKLRVLLDGDDGPVRVEPVGALEAGSTAGAASRSIRDQLLGALAREPQGLTVAELAERLGLKKRSVSNVLSQLRTERLVDTEKAVWRLLVAQAA